MTVDVKELPGVRNAIRAMAFSLQNLADSLGISIELAEPISRYLDNRTALWFRTISFRQYHKFAIVPLFLFRIGELLQRKIHYSLRIQNQ